MVFFALLFIAAVLVFSLDHHLRTAHLRRFRRDKKFQAPRGWDKVGAFLLVAGLLFLSACGGSTAPASKPVSTPQSVFITVPPANTAAQVGETASFSVVATSTAPIQYQWSKNASLLSGETSPSLTTPPVQPSDNGSTWGVTASVGGDSASASASLTVITGTATGASTFVQENDAILQQGSASVFDISFKSPVETGHTEIAAFWWNAGQNGGCSGGSGACQVPSVVSVIDDAGNTLQQVATYAQTAGINPLWIFKASNVSGTPTVLHITTQLTGCSSSNCSGNFDVASLEYTSGSTFDTSVNAAGSTLPVIQFPAFVTHTANELLISVVQSNDCTNSGGNILAGNGWAIRTSINCFAVEDSLATTSGDQAAAQFFETPAAAPPFQWQGLEVGIY